MSRQVRSAVQPADDVLATHAAAVVDAAAAAVVDAAAVHAAADAADAAADAADAADAVLSLDPPPKLILHRFPRFEAANSARTLREARVRRRSPSLGQLASEKKGPPFKQS